jgi:hypothetical protein
MNQDAKPKMRRDDDLRPEYDFSRGLRGVHAYRFSKLPSDEALVLGYWQGEGFEISSFAKNEMQGAKTPDFRLSRDGVEVAFCEVKSFQRDTWLEDQLKNALAGELVGDLLPDPIFNRISNAVHTAFKQFESVNPSHQLLNFLFFVNHDTSARSEDLDRVLTGYENPRQGQFDRTCGQFSEGRIGEEKFRVDLYVWLDVLDGRIRSQYRVLGNPQTRQQVCGLLNLNPSQIKHFPPAA